MTTIDLVPMASPAEPVVHSRTEEDPRWAAVVARDPGADGRFFYSVRTTGVYCRPSCGARRPNPGNVRFHATAGDAERAGFRACRRCRPDAPADERLTKTIGRICRMIEVAEELPRLDRLAEVAGLSPWHFHRVFKRITGVTPREYAGAHRDRRMRAELSRGPSTITEAMYASGFNSSGRFYEATNATLGMTPSAFRAGGADAEIRFAVGQCSLGAVLVAQSARGICAILLGDDPDALVRDLQDRFPLATFIGADRAFERTVATVIGFVDDPGRGLDLPLDIRGTAFQQRVWSALRRIPPGRTASYSEIARRLKMPNAARAIAGACAANPLAVAIPCHRVVRTDGALSGYRWGVERKQALLARESAAGG
jgi:AraC family transcriptional regulator of adaptative response/methylated-DNA-[protein]-cysteine methyltransferase